MFNTVEIRVAMARKGLNTTRLAEKSGVSRPVVTSIVNGKEDNITTDKIKAVADVLDLSMAEMFNENGKKGHDSD